MWHSRSQWGSSVLTVQTQGRVKKDEALTKPQIRAGVFPTKVPWRPPRSCSSTMMGQGRPPVLVQPEQLHFHLRFLSLLSTPLPINHQMLLVFPTKYFLSHFPTTSRSSFWLRPHCLPPGLLQQPQSVSPSSSLALLCKIPHTAARIMSSKHKSDHVISLHKSFQQIQNVHRIKPQSP